MIYGTDTILKFLFLSGGGVGRRREKEVEQSDARQSKYVEEYWIFSVASEARQKKTKFEWRTFNIRFIFFMFGELIFQSPEVVVSELVRERERSQPGAKRNNDVFDI